jgi:hypothetical protein
MKPMLRDYPKEVTIKSGEKVILRPMVKEDEQKLLKFFLGFPEEDRLFLKNDMMSQTQKSLNHGPTS